MEGKALVIGNGLINDIDLRRVFKRQDVNLELVHIRTAKEGLELLDSPGEFRAILLMGRHDMELTELIQRIKERSSLPVIVVNNEINKDTMSRILDMGAYAWQNDQRHIEALPLIVQCAITKYELEKERNEKEKIIAESRRQWMAVFDGITDFIFVIDDKYNIVKINQALASYFKKTPKELIGKKCFELFSCDLQMCRTKIAPLSGLSGTYEKTFGDRIYQVSIYHLFDKIPLTIHYMKDITELARLKKQLYHAEKLTSLGLLVSGVAHEINNPLTGVIAYTELLMMKTEEGPLKNELKKILQSAERCKRIVENLLTFSRQREPVKSLESINSIIERAIELRGYWLKSSNIEVIKDFGETPSLLVDAQQMQQVILNILLNAEQAITEAGRKKGKITFTTRYIPETQRIIITVTDNGTGIPEENLSKIFDPFFTTKPVGIGTGLGLSISHGIVAEHGGIIWADNSPEGGAVITIELPVKTQKGGEY